MAEDELGAIVARLRDELDAPGVDRKSTAGPGHLPGRAEAERRWAVLPGDPMGGNTASRGRFMRAISLSAKRAIRKLIRWYVQPAIFDQRRFNQVTLTMIDELERRVVEIEARLEAERK